MLRTLTIVVLAAAPAAAQTVTPVADFAVTPSQLAVGSAIDTAVTTASVTVARTSLAGLPTADRSRALASFTPAGFAVLPDIALRTSEFHEQGIRRYLRDFRAGGTGVEGRVEEAKPSSRVFGSFAQVQATTGNFDATADRARTRFDTQGAMGGIDLRFGGRSLIGIYGGYQNLDFALSDNVRKSNSEAWFAGGYGTFGLGPVYIDLFGSYGEAEYDFRRGVRFGSDPLTSGFANDLGFDSRGKSRTWLGGGTLGLSFNFGGFEFEPFAGARYSNLRLGVIDEGSNFGALRLERRTYESLLTNIGLRVGGAFEVGGATVRPEVRGGWRREWLNDNDRGFGYRFATGTGGSTPLAFTQSSPLGGDYATVGAGFTVSGPGSPLSLVIDYNGEFDSDREVHGITGGLRLTF
ncbi:hypothetical protein IP88_01030 [alpha proteobacterium AAP81b]|nr:hypothetical protein IP88_01030 [alpha proteobacterium AAP81b]